MHRIILLSLLLLAACHAPQGNMTYGQHRTHAGQQGPYLGTGAGYAP
ncbi:hypothetical protein LOC54_11595 [Acetobacter sp. AN02]|nr:hypothetical protein [Acetobacter sp. AN02]MDG6095717.1 hypothetical protein [Acetobacter sp. AN02]